MSKQERVSGGQKGAAEHLYIEKRKAYLYIFYTVFTDNTIEVCIKKFVHFLRKGFIKILTNISCLKSGGKGWRTKSTRGR